MVLGQANGQWEAFKLSSLAQLHANGNAVQDLKRTLHSAQRGRANYNYNNVLRHAATWTEAPEYPLEYPLGYPLEYPPACLPLGTLEYPLNIVGIVAIKTKVLLPF